MDSAAPKQVFESNLARGLGHLTPAQAAPGEETVFVKIKVPFNITLPGGSTAHFPAGLIEIPQSFLEHWYVKIHATPHIEPAPAESPALVASEPALVPVPIASAPAQPAPTKAKPPKAAKAAAYVYPRKAARR